VFITQIKTIFSKTLTMHYLL